MKSFFRRIFQLPVYVHLLAVIVVFGAAVFVTLKCIDSYTNHNQAVIVPDVKGLQIEDAASFLEKNQLHYVIVDSIYSKEIAPGAIVELMPEANAKVKQHRTIYVTINAKTEETAPLPDVTELSYRNAYGQLKAHGFKNVYSKYVTGEHLNLTIGVEYEDRMVDAGTRIPINAQLILIITDGNILPSDSSSIDGENPIILGSDESWF